MNLRDLMNKLDTLAEADDARAQYDKFKADDARADAAAKVKKMASIPKDQIGRLQNAIDPKTGGIFYGEAGEDAFRGSAKAYAYDWYKKGQEPEFFNIIKTAGLDIINLDGQAAVDPQALANIDKPKPPAVTDPAKPDVKDPYDANMAELDKLRDQLLATLGQDTAPEKTTDPIKKVDPKTGKPFNYGELAAATAAGGLAGKALGGTAGMGIGGLAAGGTDAAKQLYQKYATKESIARELTESFGYDFEDEIISEISATDVRDVAGNTAIGADLGKMAANKVGATTAAKFLGKAVPGAGLAFNAADAYNRYQKGDYVGAGISGLSGLANLVPGVGTAAGLGLDAVNAYRDGDLDGIMPKGWEHGKGGVNAAPAGTTVPPGGDPKVFALQQKLISKGAKIKADGKMGPATQTAMKQFGVTAESATVSEDIRTLQQRLELIETKARIAETLDSEYYFDTEANVYDTQGHLVTDRLTLDVIWESVKDKEAEVEEGYFGDIYQGVKDFAGNIKAGFKSPEKVIGKDIAGPGIRGTGAEIGKTVKNNPIKTAAGVTAAGLAGATALDKMGGQTTAPVKTTGGQTTAPAGTTSKGLTPEQQEIIAKMQKIELGYRDTEDAEILKHISAADAAIQKVTQASQAGGSKTDKGPGQDTKPAGDTNPAPDPSKAALINAATGQVDPSSVKDPNRWGQAESISENTNDELTRWLKIARG